MLDIETISVREVSHSKRTCFYPAAFSGAFILGETMILNFMRNHSDNYDGGCWKYYSCTNGAFFQRQKMKHIVCLFLIIFRNQYLVKLLVLSQ
ncbi:hypothetical protein IR318_002894 [Salmonella enterica]|nr:hypothetical protein [Salmonella enterica]